MNKNHFVLSEDKYNLKASSRRVRASDPDGGSEEAEEHGGSGIAGLSIVC